MADRTQRALGIARCSAHQHAFDRAFQDGGEVALPQITVRPDDEQQPADDAYDPLAASAGVAPSGTPSLAQRAVDWWKAQPSWLEQAAAVRQQSDPTSLRPTQAEIEFASGMVGPATIHGVRAPVAAPAVASPFYSAAEEAVKNTPMHAASGPQWLGVLRNATGVKPEELDWAGVPDFLQGRQGAVSKQELLDHIAGNKVDVQEVMKGGAGNTSQLQVAQQTDGQWIIADQSGFPIDRPFFSEGDANTELARLQRQEGPQFGSYALPGGANYRELLLTMPNKEGSRLADLEVKVNAGTATLPERQEYDSLVGQKQSYFRGSHWDEPNVLAHVRFDDRNIGGDKTLHMAEIQSDWHQKGRREGYRTEVPQQFTLEGNGPWTVRDQEGNFVRDYNNRDLAHQHVAAANAGNLPPEFQSHVLYQSNKVPDAPFKTTWPEFALKRMIRYAAENGYDRISWDSGATNAERYDLSKHVRDIEYIKQRDGSYKLGITQHNGEGLDLPKETYKPEELSDLVGKELADKIVAGEGKRYRGHEGMMLEGLDLKVGGEGMKGFYDKMLPTIANKLGKKYGARVEQSNFVHLNPKLTMDQVATDLGYGGWHSGLTAEQRAEVERVWEQRRATGKQTDIHSLKITPELRKAARQQGFPMFAKGGKVTASQMVRRHAHQQAFDQAFPR